MNKVIHGDCLETLKTFEDKSVNCVVTSPPYYQLRDYGFNGQWGLEKTYQEYLEHLWQLMDEIWRVLKDDGTVWINLGDTYGSFHGKSGGGADSFERKKVGSRYNTEKHVIDRPNKSKSEKCLLLIPHRFAIGMVDPDYELRDDLTEDERKYVIEELLRNGF